MSRFVEMKTAMLINVPFFASLMLDMLTMKVGKFPDKGIETAGTDGKTVWFDEDFLNSLTVPQAVFLCCHEIGHVMWMHMARGKRYIDTGFEGNPFDQQLWNVATDYVINAMLIQSNIGSMPPKGLHSSKYTADMLGEDVYRDLWNTLPPPPQGGGNGNGKGDGKDGQSQSRANSVQDGKVLDQHIFEPTNVSDAEMKRAIATAKNIAKAMGKMPAALERFVDEVLQPKVDWKERLRYLIQQAAGRESTTWRSPHRRRLVTQKVFMPSYTGHQAGTIIMVVDTSGSMGQREFDAAFAETAGLMRDLNPRELILMSCDAEVGSYHVLAGTDDIFSMQPELLGGGGTSFVPPFRRVEDEGVVPDALIYFTDGYGNFPDEAPKYPVIWVMTTDVEAPFGDTVKVEVSSYE